MKPITGSMTDGRLIKLAYIHNYLLNLKKGVASLDDKEFEESCRSIKLLGNQIIEENSGNVFTGRVRDTDGNYPEGAAEGHGRDRLP